MQSYDVLVVGGGIGGLYTAWRLMKNTNLTVCVLEASQRFGGRFHTILMPGGFPADLGAMRYLPLSHPILHRLIDDLSIEIEPLFIKKEVQENKFIGYFKNQRVCNNEDLVKLYSVKKEEYPYFTPAGAPVAADLPVDGNTYAAKCKMTGMLLRDVPRSLYHSLPMNPDLLSYIDDHYPLSLTVADDLAWLSLFPAGNDTNALARYHCIKGGMDTLISSLITDLQTSSRVVLRAAACVTKIDEKSDTFKVSFENNIFPQVSGKKLILACNGRGIEHISWNSPYSRTTDLQRLISRTTPAQGIKLFLTYDRPWWEENGLICGTLTTDQTIKEVTAFGSRGKSESFATLLAAFTYTNTEIFDGLNQQRYPRFVNRVGNIPEDFDPSQLTVEYVHRQLQKIFDMETIPPPVCAVQKLWLGHEDTMAANYQSRVGEDSYLLQWDALKPFPDADIFITGDTFTACSKTAAFVGWSEGVLLNSERIVANFFGVEPYLDGLELKCDRPKSKL